MHYDFRTFSKTPSIARIALAVADGDPVVFYPLVDLEETNNTTPKAITVFVESMKRHRAVPPDSDDVSYSFEGSYSFNPENDPNNCWGWKKMKGHLTAMRDFILILEKLE
ncbi:MAG: hypothetical protein WC477_04645 [Patescibacteria group bacterium]